MSGVFIFLTFTCLMSNFKNTVGISVSEFFPQIGTNLTQITWAHAVNNVSFLASTLANDNIMMIEADISMGTVPGSAEVVPIMAHPPANQSDLSLDQFMATIGKHNENENGTKKGAKLDFKSAAALEASAKIVKKYTDMNKFPIWINADILPGPVDSEVTPVDPKAFFETTKTINYTVYSIGWTTNYGPHSTGNYTAQQINDMQSTIKQYQVNKDITFPVRAGPAALSMDGMRQLLESIDNSTLTIWSSADDNVDIEKLNMLINAIGVEKIYIDVPEDLKKKIVIKSGAGELLGSSSMIVSLVLAVVSLYLFT